MAATEDTESGARRAEIAELIRRVRNIRQNLAFAFGYNAIGIPMVAGVLYPFFAVRLSPEIPAAVMAMSSLGDSAW